MSANKTTLLSHIYNEEYLLPFWLNHHKTMFDELIIIDYNSVDKSIEICKNIWPDCKVIQTQNAYFDAADTDKECMDIESSIEGIKIILNTTEFLFCEKPIKDMFSDDNVSYDVVCNSPYSLNTYDNICNTYDLFSNLLNDDIVFHNDRWTRQLHNFPNGNYTLGRHSTNNKTVSTTNAHIIWFGFYPMNNKLLERKLQIQINMSQHDKQNGLGFQHLYDKNKMLSINTEKSNSGLSLQHINLSLYNYIILYYKRMKIYYGKNENIFDVTDICTQRLLTNNIIYIPEGDHARAAYFSDVIPDIHKDIIIVINNETYTYDEYYIIKINLTTNEVSATKNLLNTLHSELILNYGNFSEELPEQKMVVKYLRGHEKVLELGGNIGRNSLIIASILTDSSKLVTIECNKNIAPQLCVNKNMNGLKFNVECSALSNRKLMQKGWGTLPYEGVLLEDYEMIETITFDELESKYDIKFDTFVIDCEGAFYYILLDNHAILTNINLIIMENDYHDISHKEHVDKILKLYNFNVDYVEAGGWGPCYNNFFEVWIKA